MKKILYFILFIMFNSYFISCDKEVAEKENGVVDIEFDNIAIVNGVQKQLNLVSPGSTTYDLKNGMNQDFNINLLKYYISNIKLETVDGLIFEDHMHVAATGAEGVYLIDESKPASSLVSLENVPAGQYKSITFNIGVEEKIVTEGAAGGVLDPATCNMFWNWNSGYIAFKFEGQSSVSNGGAGGETINNVSNGIAYHVGGWRTQQGTAFVNNIKTVTLDFDTNAKVEKGEQPEVHLTFDILKVFAHHHTVDFTGNHNVHKPSDGVDMAGNMAHAFAFDHIHQ